MTICLIVLFLMFVLVEFGDWYYKFKPTEYFIIRTLKLYRINPGRFENLFSLPIREVEILLHTLIQNRCVNTKHTHSEIRNGLVLFFYPEGDGGIERIWKYNYMDIFDPKTNVTLFIGFDDFYANLSPKYKMVYEIDDDIMVKMCFRMGIKITKLNSMLKDDKSKKRILSLYRDFLIRYVM